MLGIGNPGAGFNRTYHNVGVRAVEHIAEHERITSFKRPGRRPFEYARSGNLIIARSLTFMNDSGRAAKAVIGYFKVLPQEFLLLHDDSDLMVGSYKLAFGQGAAGHRGVDSVVRLLGTKRFWRGRIGIRRSGDERRAESFVLSTIQPEDREVVDRAVSELTDAILAETV